MLDRYRKARAFTAQLCAPLLPEDCIVQSMPDVSPTRWHLAHTTWFFETFVVLPHVAGSEPFSEVYGYLFNSYYNTVGKQFPRDQRGLLSRPSVSDVWEYRRHVDQRVSDLLESSDLPRELLALVELGVQHEQQHQELMLTDIKHVLSCNPIFPAYDAIGLGPGSPSSASSVSAVEPGVGANSEVFDSDAPSARRPHLVPFDRAIRQHGHDGSGFAYDNESPQHECLISAFALSDRLVTNGQYLEFINDGGYQTAEHWLSMGWNQVQSDRWDSPLYWLNRDGQWLNFTLAGLQPVAMDEPVCHVSYFEADAFARWSGHRLPTEFEWEYAAHDVPIRGNFADTGRPHPARRRASCDATNASSSAAGRELSQLWGDAWEWTSSAYSAYPGYCPDAGALGEYNGKFMCNQFVLRGGSCATSSDHIRATYRNFFPPDARWQFTGIRLAKDAAES